MQTQILKDSIILTCDTQIRADSYLANALNLSRAKVQKLIQQKEFLHNGITLEKSALLVKKGDTILFKNSTLPAKQTKSKDNLEIQILYEDEDLLILNKPESLIVHQTNEQDTQFTLVQWLQEKNYSLSNLGDSYREGIVHRLDKGTSGAIVIAKNNFAHTHLSAQLQMRTMGRYYVCVIDKNLKTPQIIEHALMRHPKNRLKYIATKQANPDAKSAKTAFFNIANTLHLAQSHTLIGAKLFSGRTHQIRAHLSAINCHILGDTFYGYKGDFTHRILLHAHLLYLTHPRSQKMLTIYAPFLGNMQDFLHANFNLTPYIHKKQITIPLDTLYKNTFN